MKVVPSTAAAAARHRTTSFSITSAGYLFRFLLCLSVFALVGVWRLRSIFICPKTNEKKKIMPSISVIHRHLTAFAPFKIAIYLHCSSLIDKV